MWGGLFINPTPEYLQITKHKSVRRDEQTPSWSAVFSGKVYHPEPPHAQSISLFLGQGRVSMETHPFFFI